mgnify:CR=1 FL=1
MLTVPSFKKLPTIFVLDFQTPYFSDIPDMEDFGPDFMGIVMEETFEIEQIGIG